MRLLVFYDLPVLSSAEKRAYARFHKFLLRNGYDMIQFSVYARLCNGQDMVEKHIIRLMANLPSEGSIRCMQITEKQFTGIRLLVGVKTKKENPKYSEQLTFF
jgi:CRISPR-associated protein Cas2